jgi:hypothetical protein
MRRSSHYDPIDNNGKPEPKGDRLVAFHFPSVRSKYRAWKQPHLLFFLMTSVFVFFRSTGGTIYDCRCQNAE